MLKIKPRIASEHEEQASLTHWAYLAKKTRPDLDMLVAIPNGGLRSKATAGKLRAEGVRPGYPDLALNVARGGYHGLFIEMKRTSGGATSPEQKEWLEKLDKQGHKAIVCKGWLQAKSVIEWYLDGAKDD